MYLVHSYRVHIVDITAVHGRPKRRKKRGPFLLRNENERSGHDRARVLRKKIPGKSLPVSRISAMNRIRGGID